MVINKNKEAPPWLVVYAGPSGSGKTSTGQIVSRELGIPFYDIDLLRQEMFPLPPHVADDVRGLNYKKAQDDATLRRVHEESELRTGRDLMEGRSTSMAKTLRSPYSHQAVESHAGAYNARLFVVLFESPTELLKRRIVSRSHPFVSTVEDLQDQLSGYTPFPRPAMIVNTETTLNPEESAAQVILGLRMIDESRFAMRDHQRLRTG